MYGHWRASKLQSFSRKLMEYTQATKAGEGEKGGEGLGALALQC